MEQKLVPVRHRGVWLWLAIFGFSLPWQAGAAGPETPSGGVARNDRVSPEEFLVLARSGEPAVLVHLDGKNSIPPVDESVVRVYYTLTPSTRIAADAVLRDGASAARSYRLTGTPLDWEEMHIPLPERLAAGPQSISPAVLASAIADEADLQLVDLRGPASGADAPSIGPARRLLPHEFDEALPQFSKRRWLVLVDDGHGAAEAWAHEAFSRGYRLVAVLQGGYPAWVAAPDR